VWVNTGRERSATMLLAAKDRGAAELEPASCAKGRRSNASNYAREPTTNDVKRDHLSLSLHAVQKRR
jgi:hypothetical protein